MCFPEQSPHPEVRGPPSPCTRGRPSQRVSAMVPTGKGLEGCCELEAFHRAGCPGWEAGGAWV